MLTPSPATWVYVHEDISSTGNPLSGVRQACIFNTAMRVCTSIGYGNGWRLNYHQTVVPETTAEHNIIPTSTATGPGINFEADQRASGKDEMGNYFGLTIDTGSADAGTSSPTRTNNMLKFNSSDT
jgi:hypothetical protein